MFSDSSKVEDEFIAYGILNDNSCLIIFTGKCRCNENSLPTFCVGIFSAVRCWFSVLKTCSLVKINIFISIDTQLLSWLFTHNIQTKNQFTRKRLKDICWLIKELKEKKNSVDINFKYVRTLENPTELLTKGFYQ